MTFLESYALLNDTTTVQRITVAIYAAAAGVFGELPETPDHAVRLAWATRALTGDGVTERRVTNYLVTRPDPMTVLATDATLLAFVNSLVTPLAKLP